MTNLEIMCINLVTGDKCKLKLSDSLGRRDVQIAIEINNRFKELANSRATKEEAPLGVTCGGPHCCYISGRFASMHEWPYYNI